MFFDIFFVVVCFFFVILINENFCGEISERIDVCFVLFFIYLWGSKVLILNEDWYLLMLLFGMCFVGFELMSVFELYWYFSWSLMLLKWGCCILIVFCICWLWGFLWYIVLKCFEMVEGFFLYRMLKSLNILVVLVMFCLLLLIVMGWCFILYELSSCFEVLFLSILVSFYVMFWVFFVFVFRFSLLVGGKWWVVLLMRKMCFLW